jgi:hypothetical protein
MTILSSKTHGDTYEYLVDSDPNGVETALQGSTAKMQDGSAAWINTDGGTTWIRTDGAAVPEAMGAVTNEPTGFEDPADSIISFSDAGPDRTFQIAPAADEFSFWIKGKEHVKSGTETIQSPDVEGLHWFYYDTAAVLQTTQVFTESLVLEKSLIAGVYWDATNKKSWPLYEERHGKLMPGAVHLALHRAIHAYYNSGLSLPDIVADGSGNDDASAQIGIEAGTIGDEDILHSIAGQAKPASTVVLYKDGPNGYWRWGAATDFPLLTAGTGRAAWNEWTGATWQVTEADSGRFVNTHEFATNDIGPGFAVVMGQATYQNRNSAREGAKVELTQLNLDGLPGPEWVSLGTTIWETRDTYTNAVKSRAVSPDGTATYVDWRGRSLASGGGASGTPVNHGDGHVNGTDDVPAFVGDSGAGGTRGVVPAPAAGDAAAGKVLSAGGGWIPVSTPKTPVQSIYYSAGGIKPVSRNDRRGQVGWYPHGRRVKRSDGHRRSRRIRWGFLEEGGGQQRRLSAGRHPGDRRPISGAALVPGIESVQQGGGVPRRQLHPSVYILVGWRSDSRHRVERPRVTGVRPARDGPLRHVAFAVSDRVVRSQDVIRDPARGLSQLGRGPVPGDPGPASGQLRGAVVSHRTCQQ